jgi:hypothetical protein
MTDTQNIGSTSTKGGGDGRKWGAWWLWLLLPLLLVAALAALLAARNAGDDDPEGIGLSAQECPDDAGEAQPRKGSGSCATSAVSSLPATGDEPVLVPRADGADAAHFVEFEGRPYVEGELVRRQDEA